MTEKPKDARFTQQMVMHLNGGNEFSSLHYDVYFNGVKTNIIRLTHTTGSPEYTVDADELHFGEETFDMLKDKNVHEWLLARANKLNIVP